MFDPLATYTTWATHYPQMSMMTHQNLCHSVRHWTLTLTLTLKNLRHHCHLPLSPPQNLHERVKEEWKKGQTLGHQNQN